MTAIWKHLGSTISVIIGILYFASGVAALQSKAADLSGLYAGPIMIFGGLAYRSAKTRRLNPTKRSTVRVVGEILAICIILYLWLGQPDLKDQIATNPVPAFVIPVWALIAYGIALIWKSRKSSPESKGTSA